MKTLALLFLIPTLVFAHVGKYVNSSSGNDNNDGSIGSPYATIGKALTVVAAGDTIWLRAGTFTYSGTTRLTLSANGSAGNYYCLWAYPGETVWIDFSGQNNFGDIMQGGIELSGSYWHLKRINERDNHTREGCILTGSHNIVEFCSFIRNGLEDEGTGLMIYGRSEAQGAPLHAHDNLILNCDSYDNYSGTGSGGNSDGFDIIYSIGTGNTLRGCRSWHNSDDGFDCWNAIQPVTFDSCWAINNGVDQGNGNGFKLGGSGSTTDAHMILRHCLAAYNICKTSPTSYGFTDNLNPAGNQVYNCTGAYNKQNWGYFGTNKTGTPDTLINNLSYANSVSNTPVVDAPNRQTTNSWSGFTVTSGDFQSVDSTGLTGPRNADGSLPTTNFLRPVVGSDLKDAGTDMGLPYSGTKPDLGYLEYTTPTVTLSVSVSYLADFGTVTVGQSSAVGTYTISGENLLGDVTITAPTDFQVSLNSTDWSSVETVSPTGGIISATTIYAKFVPSTVGVASGNITNESSGATTKNVAVSGTGATQESTSTYYLPRKR